MGKCGCCCDNGTIPTHKDEGVVDKKHATLVGRNVSVKMTLTSVVVLDALII